MSSADCARGLCPLDSRPSPGRRPPQTAPEGSALWTPAPRRNGVLCGPHQRALPSGLPLLAGVASYADRTRGLCPLDSRWSLRPRPRDATHLIIACGRDGDFEVSSFLSYYADRPAKSRAGRSTYFSASLHKYFIFINFL